MPTAKPRITITLQPHSYEVLSRLSVLSRQSMASIVADLFETAIPSMERVVVVMERASVATQEVRDGLSAAVERAERDLMPTLLEAIGQSDLFLDSLESASPKRGSEPAAELVSAPGSRVTRRGVASNPRPVTRG